jgi:Uma2 family endonuclease
MASTTTRLIYDDLEAIPQAREGDRHELIDGELIVTPSPIPVHQIVSLNLVRQLDQHVNATGLGRLLYAPVDIRFTPGNVLIPDIVFITCDRLHIIGPKAIDGPPDLVIEILSPGTRQRDLSVKHSLYARFGVGEYWIVDPEARTMSVFSLIGDRYEPVPTAADGMIHSRVLPELELTLATVFEGI